MRVLGINAIFHAPFRPRNPVMISIVVSNLGRDSLADLLATLAEQVGDRPDLEIVLVDDRPTGGGELPVPGALTAYTKVLSASWGCRLGGTTGTRPSRQ